MCVVDNPLKSGKNVSLEESDMKSHVLYDNIMVQDISSNQCIDKI